MVLLFLTRQKSVCDFMADRLKTCGHIATVCTTEKTFFQTLSSCKKSVHVLLIDFSFFDHHSFNIFAYLKEHSFNQNVIFYNHPFPQEDERIDFWCKQNASHNEDFVLLCKQINQIISSPELLPCISLINPPRDLNPAAMLPHENFNCSQFQILHSIGPVKMRLFQMLFDHLGHALTAEQLCMHVWGSYDEKKLNTLYSYIHDLRQCCRSELMYEMDIVRIGQKKYQLVFTLPHDLNIRDEQARKAFERNRHLFEDARCV
ncbi:MAG TPA: hypothetical protein DCQ43_00835 [Treponema sp.]|nr:hypothetical protein [Treponema sp.]